MRISDWSSDVCSSDLVMAFCNAPLGDADHALNACAAALSMATALDRLNAEALDDARKGMAGAELLRIGVGLNTGLCVVGDMGSEQRFDYSDRQNVVSGKEVQVRVNLGGRRVLEKKNK